MNTAAKGRVAVSRVLLIVCLVSSAGLSTLGHAETAYISDKLTVPMRSGPSNSHRILHHGLPAGTKMEVLKREGDFSQIVTSRGTQGWVPTQYLTSQPIARDRLRAAQSEVQRIRSELDKQKAALNQARQQGSASSKDNSRLAQELAEKTAELEKIQKISKNAIAEHAENQRLNDMNANLRDELEDLTDERDRLRSNVQQRWLMIGGGLVLAGLLLGILLKSRPRRSAWT